jgi:hypothetical protein
MLWITPKRRWKVHRESVVNKASSALQKMLAIASSSKLANLSKLRNIRKNSYGKKFCCDRKNPQVLTLVSPKTVSSDESIVSEIKGFYRCPVSVFTQLFGSS